MSDLGAEIVERKILSDDLEPLTDALRGICERGDVNLIVTTGVILVILAALTRIDVAATIRRLQQDLDKQGWNIPLLLVLPEILTRDLRIARRYRPLAPTVYHAEGAAARAEPLTRAFGLQVGALRTGRSLLSLVASGRAETAPDAFGETYYPYYHFGWSPLVYVRSGRYKYIDAPRPELYDLRDDPRETRNLAGLPDYHEVEEELSRHLQTTVEATS